MREKPDISKKDPSESRTKNGDLWGCIQALWIGVIGYIVLSSVMRVFSRRGEKIDGVIFFGALAFLVVAVILTERNKKRDRQRLHDAQQEWQRTCKSEEVTIVSREHYGYESYFDDYGDYHPGGSSHHLELELTSDQKAVDPNRKIVNVDVSRQVYEMLQNRDTVRIYYKPEAPLTFLLEGEI